MSDFKTKMHENRFRLGLRPRPRWGSLQRSPDPLAGFKGPTSKGRKKGGRGGKGRKGRGREEGEGKGGEGKGMEGKNVLPHVKQAVAAYDSKKIFFSCRILTVWNSLPANTDFHRWRLLSDLDLQFNLSCEKFLHRNND